MVATFWKWVAMTDLMDARQCTAMSKRSRERCKRAAIPGGTTCAIHGGKAPQVRAAARRRLEAQAALAAVDQFGLPVEIDPQDALLEEVHRTAGHIAWCELMLKVAEPDDVDRWHRIDLDERQHLARVAKAAIDAGLAERTVRLAEEQGRMVAAVIRAIFDDPELGLTVAQRDIAPSIARRHLLQLPVVGETV